MKIGLRSCFALAGLWLALGSAVAQQNPTQNPNLPAPEAAAPPIAGANSFSEGQARDLIQSQGYVGVSALVNDRHGIWHGTARKGATRFHVFVDYKGNVTARQE
ncbi:MAG: PepSY protein [Tardiphaga sp.]|jgi:hypothetical protein|nr:PepSY protein [Tardiphaga sp.]